MTKRKTRKASWLLTVASAYSVLPGCSDEPATDQADANVASHDSGVTVSAPRKDAATADGSSAPIDTSGAGEVVDTADDVDITTLIGVIFYPPTEGHLPQMDAGITNTPPATDASVANDASVAIDVKFPVGVVVIPPDASVLAEGALSWIFVIPPRTVP